MNIHPSAIVSPDAQLAPDVEVGPFTIIDGQVAIGAGTRVGPHCVLTGRTTIGEGNEFFSGAQIGILSQDKKHVEGLVGRTLIGHNNQFREHCTISASTMEADGDAGRATRIGSGCLFMAYSHVGHDSSVGDEAILSNCAALAGHVHIEAKAVISGLCGVHQECNIGRLAFVGGMSGVTQDVPPFFIAKGNPARIVGPNAVGLQRNGFDAKARARVKQMFRLLYRAGLNTTQALNEIEARVEDSPERAEMLAFIRASKRGIVSL